MSRKQPITLVLGATGRTGGAVIRELLADPGPERVVLRAAGRRREALDALARGGMQTVQLDLDGIERTPLAEHRALHEALAGVDRMFLLTGYSVDMLVQSKVIVDAAKLAGVQHIVHMGAAGHPDETVAHAVWHQLVERYIEASGVGYTHLQPNVFMQNLLAFGAPGGVIKQYVGDAKLGWVDLDDIARAAATVLRSPAAHRGRTYRLTTDARTVHEVAEILTAATGKRFRYEPRPPDEWLAAVLATNAMEPVYARDVHNDFVRANENRRPGSHDVFDDYEQLTGRPPLRWRDHAVAHRSEYIELAAPRSAS
jgi:NAD(P)H dehydrogenase (quinone)